MRFRRPLIALVGVSAALALSACGMLNKNAATAGAQSSSSHPAGPMSEPMSEPMESGMVSPDPAAKGGMGDGDGDEDDKNGMGGMGATGQFGPACAKVPAGGAGSFAGMAKSPVATAAGNNPLLSTLVTAVKKANLVDTLNKAPHITVFAPDNEAFAKIPQATLTKLLADPAGLAKLLEYHVVAQQIDPDDLEKGSFTTLSGAVLKTAGSGHDFTVGASKVVCGNVRTANATVYIIDAVLMPPAK
jgi:uncharacterized surface protein with fasciclin (FAS1) repeats